MRNSEKVKIQNIYELLAYAIRSYEVATLENVGYSQYSGLDSILAEILITGVSAQRKKGLEHGYQEQRGDLQFIKGRIHILETEIRRRRGSLLADCSYDEFVVDTYNNRILKAAMTSALSNPGVTALQKRRIKSLLPYFDSVAIISPMRIDWTDGKYDRNNASYRILKHIAYLLINGLGIDTTEEHVVTSGIKINNLANLFQNFVASYFVRHYPALRVRTEPVLKAGIDTPADQLPPAVPRMQPDIVLESAKRILAIDTKYYSRILVDNGFGKQIMHTSHRYQITTYVQHLAAKTDLDVMGMLLYAQTDGERQDHTNFRWRELGHQLEVRTLDLNQDFVHIAASLDRIVYEYFPGINKAD